MTRAPSPFAIKEFVPTEFSFGPTELPDASKTLPWKETSSQDWSFQVPRVKFGPAQNVLNVASSLLQQVDIANLVSRFQPSARELAEKNFIDAMLSFQDIPEKVKNVKMVLREIHYGQLVETWSNYQKASSELMNGIQNNLKGLEMLNLLKKRNELRKLYLEKACMWFYELDELDVGECEQLFHVDFPRVEELYQKVISTEATIVPSSFSIDIPMFDENPNTLDLSNVVKNFLQAAQELIEATDLTKNSTLKEISNLHQKKFQAALWECQDLCGLKPFEQFLDEIERNKQVLLENIHKVERLILEYDQGFELAQEIKRFDKQARELDRQCSRTRWEVEDLQHDVAVNSKVVEELQKRLVQLTLEKTDVDTLRSECQAKLAKLSERHVEFTLSLGLFGLPTVPLEARIPESILNTGKVVDRTFEKYEFVKPLGKKVQLLKWKGKHVVLKQLDRRGFLREAGVLCRINHPNIVPVNAVFWQHQQYYIEMPFFSLGNLQDFIPGKPLGIIRGIFKQLADALLFLSREEVHHGDLSLRNVVLKNDPTSPIPVLIDFESATRDINLTTTVYNIHATIGYLPPEIKGPTKPNEAWDVWSLGVMLYKAVMGDAEKEVRALDGTMFEVWKQDVAGLGDENLLTLLTKMLEKDVEKRYKLMQVCQDRFWFGLQQDVTRVNDARIDRVLQAISRARSQRATLCLKIERSRLVEDVEKILKQFVVGQQWPEVHVVFRGEDGVDAGGLKRELVSLYFKNISRDKELFECFEASQLAIPIPGDKLERWQCFGKMIAFAMIHEIKIPRLPWIVIKGLKNDLMANLMDVDQLDCQLASSWKWMLVSGDKELEALEEEWDGQVVNEENVRCYVNGMIQEKCVNAREIGYNAIRQGFESCLNGELKALVEQMTWRELDSLLNGLPWGSKELLQVVVMQGLDQEEEKKQREIYQQLFEEWEKDSDQPLMKFVQFCTGATALPERLIIAHFLSSQALPTSHTCYFTVEVAKYDTMEETKAKWEIALANSGGFNLA